MENYKSLKHDIEKDIDELKDDINTMKNETLRMSTELTEIKSNSVWYNEFQHELKDFLKEISKQINQCDFCKDGTNISKRLKQIEDKAQRAFIVSSIVLTLMIVVIGVLVATRG
jgi:cell division protein FtsX